MKSNKKKKRKQKQKVVEPRQIVKDSPKPLSPLVVEWWLNGWT